MSRKSPPKAEVQKALPFGPARYIRSLRRYTPQQIGFLKNPKGSPFSPFTISKSLSFLSLRYGADFRRSRLVDFSVKKKTKEVTRVSREYCLVLSILLKTALWWIRWTFFQSLEQGDYLAVPGLLHAFFSKNYYCPYN